MQCSPPCAHLCLPAARTAENYNHWALCQKPQLGWGEAFISLDSRSLFMTNLRQKNPAPTTPLLPGTQVHFNDSQWGVLAEASLCSHKA